MSYRLSSPRPPALAENDVERQCLDWLRARGWYPIRLHSALLRTLDNRFVRIGEIGLPDYVVLHARCPAFFLETKRPGAGLSPRQIKKRWELQTAYRLPVAVADGVETLAQWLKNHELEQAMK